jgi:large subunit ribosomal protein L15
MADQLMLHDLKPAPGSRKSRIRVGRGGSARRGSKAGRGTKGINARNKLRPGFEGGQTPLARRLPKLKGFNNPNREEFAVVNIGALSVFEEGSVVTPDTLRDTGLAKRRGRIKILAEGELATPITIEAHAFSAAARRKIEKAGGKWGIVG